MLFPCLSRRTWLTCLAGVLGLSAFAPAAPVISELMFRPAGVVEDQSREWVELYLQEGSVDLSGWKFTKGITFTFPPRTVMTAGSSLIVAADPPTFADLHLDFTGALTGGWTGNLANRGETIQLEDAAGNIVEEISYADEGDSALRAVAPMVAPLTGQPLLPPLSLPFTNALDFPGWEWISPAHGGGYSLERRSVRVPGTVRQNWASSSFAGGTPGSAGVDNGPQVFLAKVRHAPVVPRSTQAITVYANVLDQIDGTALPAQTLHWRRDGAVSFTAVPMTLAWSEAGIAGNYADQTFSATIPAQPNNIIIEYYVAVTGDLGEPASWPAKARISAPGTVPEVYAQAANALLQVDNTFSEGAAWVPGARPVYRVIMPAVERELLRRYQTTGSKQESDAAMNATFISQDGGGIELKYLTSVRNRGFGSRLGPPNNFHVSMRGDDLWKDRPAIQLNCRYPHSQVLASNIFALAGIAEQQARPVRLIMNGVSLAETGSRMYGSYARIETLNGDWVDRHFPGDRDGNLYRVDDHEPNPQGAIPGDLGSGEFRYEGANPLAYADTFLKRTNEDLDEWNDLIELCRVVSAPVTGGSAAQPAISDADYPQRVRQLINVDQWFTYLALDALVGNQEGGLPTGRADDFAIYRGVLDPRFTLIPHDFDTCFDFNTTDGLGNPVNRTIWSFHDGSASLLGLQRLFTHPDLVPFYYQKMLHLVNNVVTPERLNPLIDELIGSWAGPAAATVKTFLTDRRTNVLSQIPQTWSLTTNLTTGPGGYPESATGAVTFWGTFHVAETRSLRLNGQPGVLKYRTLGAATAGTWSYSATAASGFLTKGLNRVVAEFYDGPNGTGRIVQRYLTDILVTGDGTFTSVQGTLTPV